jgi:membrane dipeptidase
MLDAATGPIVPSFVCSEPVYIEGQSYVERLLSAGMNAVSVSIGALRDDFETVLRTMHQYHNLFLAEERSTLVRTTGDIEDRVRDGRLGIIFWSQTGGMVEDQLWRWSVLHALGLRVCGIAYNESNILGYGCVDPEDRGLTSFGRQAVQEMNYLGITVDITHSGPRTSMEAVEYSSQPVIASHSNAHSLCASHRNLSDELIRAIAERGGVIGVSPLSIMTYREVGVRPTLSDYLDMLEHILQLVGPDHVAIGSDVFECNTKIVWEATFKRKHPMPWTFETQHASDFDKMHKWPNAVAGLLERGYSDEDLVKIIGLNWLRVFKQTWRDESGKTGGGDAGWAAVPDLFDSASESRFRADHGSTT